MSGARFTYRTEEDFFAAEERDGVALPYSRDLSPLAARKTIGDSDVTLRNSLTIHPMEGFDSTPDGAPGDLTVRRIRRMASGGAGLCWIEATAVVEEGRTNTGQLWIHEGNLDAFKALAEEAHRLSDGAPVILQLTHSGRFSKPDNTPRPVITYHNPVMNEKMPISPDWPVISDEELDALPEKFGAAAKMAKDAGFDGADIKCCHKYLFSELLSAYSRPGRYGGSFENRTRLFLDAIRAAAVHRDRRFVLASRFGPVEMIPHPWGFGMARDGSLTPDWEEPDRLYRLMYECGIRLVDMTLGSPYYNPHINRPYDNGGYEPPEPRLTGVARLIDAAAHMKKTVPGITLIGTGYSYLRTFAPYVAAGAVGEGMADAAGFGRMAFAYPDLARDILEKGALDPAKVCLTCSQCTAMMRRMHATGCPIRDREVYLPMLRELFPKE
ncbi:MAG: flavin oxidoreductase/NADH oxidase [Clostridia bacterium]|nr:flavin oxidoreductase/NADH oxidase [Clostridia bacterium]